MKLFINGFRQVRIRVSKTNDAHIFVSLKAIEAQRKRRFLLARHYEARTNQRIGTPNHAIIRKYQKILPQFRKRYF